MICYTEYMLRLDKLLHSTYPQFSRKQWSTFCTQGYVIYRNQICTKSHELPSEEACHLDIDWERIHQHVHWNLVPSDNPIEILYMGQGLLVANKPSNLHCHPNSPEETDSLVHRLAHIIPESKEQQQGFLLNRIDYETSGLVLSATSRESFEKWQPCFRKTSDLGVTKVYTALVWGIPTWTQTTSTDSIGHLKNQRNRVGLYNSPNSHHGVQDFRGNPVPARTEFILEQTGFLKPPGKPIPALQASVVEARLDHGMMHQVRVHLQGLGHPLAGDKIYGPQVYPLLSPHGLHCKEIRIDPCPDFPQGISWGSRLPDAPPFCWFRPRG